MLLTTGRKESLSISKGSEIEVSTNEFQYSTGNIWYSVILEDNLAKSKRKTLPVRHLHPLLKEDYTPPLIKSTFHRLIRPVPPPDPFPDSQFEEGDVVDAVHEGAWWCGSVVKVLGNQRYLVYVRFYPDVIEFERKHLRPHLEWKQDEWFRCEKLELIDSDFSAGKSVEVRIEDVKLGDIWAPGIAITENKMDGTLRVKYKYLRIEEDKWDYRSLPYSKIRPSPPSFGSRVYSLMENVDAFLESGWWCPGVVSKVQIGERYAVLLGRNKETKEFSQSDLRPSMKWKDGVWQAEEATVMDTDDSPHAAEETTTSTRRRVKVGSPLRGEKALGTGKKLRVTRSSSGTKQDSSSAISNGGDVAETSKVSVIENETPLSETAALLPGELETEMANAVINENSANTVINDNSPVTTQPDIPATKEAHSTVILGISASPQPKPAAKTQGKTSPRKKLQATKNLKGSANDSVGEKVPEETKNRGSVNKRKRGQPRKFISTEPKEKTGVAANGSNAATIEFEDVTDDNQPLASWIHGKSQSRTPDPIPNSVVEKHVDVVETPSARDSTIALPFAKKSPLWKVIESMEPFKAVPQSPHFSPLLESEEEFREGDAIGVMVMFTGLLEKVNEIQVEDSISSMSRLDECFIKMEKHGFNVSAPRAQIRKLLAIKERQTWALEELKVVKREIREKDSKRRKCEEDIEVFSSKVVELKEAKVTMDNEIAGMQSHAADLDQKVQKVEEEFRAIAATPWK